MRRIRATIGVVAVAAVAGFAIASLGHDTRTYQGTIDSAQLQGASAELEVSDDGAILVWGPLSTPAGGPYFGPLDSDARST